MGGIMWRLFWLTLFACADHEHDHDHDHDHDHEFSLPAGDEINGEELYATRCSGCHGSSADGASAPSILYMEDVHFIEAIQDGIGNMPAFPDLSTEDIADIVAFVRTLQD